MAPAHALSIVPVTGPPGAGKTSALLSIVEQYPQIARFGVRDYALRLAQLGDPRGLMMREMLARNELFSDDLVRYEFTHFLRQVPASVTAVAVEGYPRDLRQCDDLMRAVAEHGMHLPAFVIVDVPDDVAKARAANRMICVQCGLPAHQDAGRCAACAGTVAPRGDDAPVQLVRRIAEYRRLGADVWAYFHQRGLLRIVDGRRGRGEVCSALAALLLNGPSRLPAPV